MNYDFSQKRHWRRTVWNGIRERLEKPVRESLVLYLAAEQDEDREIALQKGFREENLIAVDRRLHVVDSLRAQRRLALHGDVIDVASNWNPAVEVDAVALDFCCGMSRDISLKLPRLTLAPQCARAVFMVNMLRGRDAATNEWRQSLAEWGDVTKHRGELLFRHMAQVWLLGIGGLLEVDEAGDVVRKPDEIPNKGRIEADWGGAILHSRRVMHSYRSTANQTFDTLIFRNPAGAFNLAPRELGAVMQAHSKGSQLRKQAAAVLAHRTRRLGAVRTA